MPVKPSEVRSGVFVLLAVAVLGVLLFSVGKVRARFAAQHAYHSYLSDVKFLKAHDAVTVGGIRVGEIRRVEVSEDRFGHVRVTISVDADVVVREDSILILKQDGMLGPKYIEISAGTPGGKPAKPGSELKSLVPPAITDLTAAIQNPLGRIDKVLEHLEAILGKPENQKNLGDILAETRNLLAGMNEQIRKLGEGVAKMTDQANAVVGEVQTTVRANREVLNATLKEVHASVKHVEPLLDNLTALSQKLITASESLDQLLRDADGVVLQNNKNIFESIRAMRDTAYHMEAAAKRIRANPAILLFGADESEDDPVRADETQIRLKGRARRYDKEGK